MKLILLALLLSSTMAMAAGHFEFDGFGRVRSVSQNNYNFDSDTNDDMNFTDYRFQVNVKAAKSKDSKTYVYLTNRFNKRAGDYTGSNQTSGSLGNESSATFHQAYIGHKFNDRFSMKAGRQELNYGDQLMVGGVGWHNVGRAFDGYTFAYKSNWGTTDLFVMTVKELDGGLNGKEDHDFKGIYHSGSFGSVKNLDLYLLLDNDPNTNTKVQALGVRAKSKMGAFDYRAEVVSEKVDTGTADETASMYDVEVGYSMNKFRFAAEISSASEFFNDLYPTAHKWMGFADLFWRKNIEQKAVHVGYKHDDKTAVKLSYHLFSRVKKGNTNFSFGSPAGVGAATGDDDLGSEIDLTVKHQLDTDLALQAGYSIFTPGDYFGAALDDKVSWSYLQLLAKF